MKRRRDRFVVVGCALAALISAEGASAQAADPTGGTPDADSTPAPASPPPAATGGAAACVLGSHDGIGTPDARTSAALVCEALREAGVYVGAQPISAADAASHGSAYRVDLQPLGTLIVLRASHESPPGSTEQSRSLRLQNIEEVAVAAPRIADSLVRGVPLDETAKVDSLVGQETRTYSKQHGETLFGFGVFGMAMPDETYAGFGAFGRLYYEASRYAIGLDLRVGGSSDQSEASLVGISVGARYFVTDGDITPFVGGGVGVLWLGLTAPGSDPAFDDDLDGSGLAFFGEVGVEFLRMHNSRLDVFLRADPPVFDLERDGSDKYMLPISLLASYSFD